MKKIISLIFVFLLTLSLTANAAYTGLEIYNSMEKAFDWADENASPLGDADSVASDYLVMALARANRSFDFGKYIKITRSKKPETIEDVHRVIMSNAASGGRLDEKLVADNTYNAEFKSCDDLAGAIIALSGGEYEVKPANNSIDAMAAKLISNQLSDGSFDKDIVTTAKSIIALSFCSGRLYAVDGDYKDVVYYYDVNNSILRAVNYLQNSKNDDFGYGNIINTAYVVMALDSAGVDADNDLGFSANGQSVLGYLISKQLPDGSFSEQADDNAFALCALASHLRAMQGKSSFFALRSDDRLENPDVYTEDINRSGEGLKTDLVNTEAIKITFAENIEEPEKTPFKNSDITANETAPLEETEKPERSKTISVILICLAVLVVTAVIMSFIMHFMGIKPRKKWFRGISRGGDDG